jgi:hypothetical protein
MQSAVLILGQTAADLQAAAEYNVDDLNFMWEWVWEKCATF